MKDKLKAFLIFSVFILLAGLFCFLLINNSIQCSSNNKLDYDRLKYEELNFEEYKTIHVGGYKSHSYIHELYFTEYERPFVIDSIALEGINKRYLEDLNQDELIKVYYRESSRSGYDYDICEIQSDSKMILSLSDYKKQHTNDQILGFILYPILMLGFLYVAIVWPLAIIYDSKHQIQKKKHNKQNNHRKRRQT